MIVILYYIIWSKILFLSFFFEIVYFLKFFSVKNYELFNKISFRMLSSFKNIFFIFFIE